MQTVTIKILINSFYGDGKQNNVELTHRIKQWLKCPGFKAVEEFKAEIYLMAADNQLLSSKQNINRSDETGSIKKQLDKQFAIVM